MKKGMTRLIALLLALMLTLSMSALAAETVSDGFRVDGAQARPEESEGDGTEGEPETGNEIPTAPDATKEPVEIPAEPVGRKQVCLNSDSDSVKIFESADSASPVVGNAFHGDVVDVFVSVDGWTFIRMGGTKGWIASGHLKEVGAADAPEPTATPEPTPEPTPVPVPEEPVGQKQVCLNNATDSVSVFEAADGASAVVGSLNHGDVVDVYMEAGAWTLVRARGLEGWIASAHLKAVGSAEPKQPEEAEVPGPTEPEETGAPVPELPKMYVVLPAVDGMVNVRESAGNDGRIIGTLRHGDAVAVLGRDGGWVQVRTADGTEGFVYEKYLSEVKPEAAAPGAAPEPEAIENPEATAEPEAAEEPEVPAFEYERDEEGNLVLDENGDPIPVIPEGATQKPVAYQRDEEGNLVLDENGNPIPLQYLPVEAEIVVTEKDEEVPERRVDVYINWAAEAEEHAYGDEAVLTAVLTGYEGLEYEYQWQTGKDEASYADVAGANGATHSFAVTEENVNDYWRVEVTITGVADEAA